MGGSCVLHHSLHYIVLYSWPCVTFCTLIFQALRSSLLQGTLLHVDEMIHHIILVYIEYAMASWCVCDRYHLHLVHMQPALLREYAFLCPQHMVVYVYCIYTY